MHRLLPALLASACVVGVAVAAVAVPGSQQHTTTRTHSAQRGLTPVLPGSVNIVRFQRFGGAQRCDGDSCGVGVPGDIPQFTLPSSPTKYRSTLTVSFRFRAWGNDATFAVRPRLNGAADVIRLVPGTRPLLSTGGRLDTATLVVRPALLSGGVAYKLHVDPRITHRLVKAGIKLTRVLYSVQAWSA
jgi:hypothetical protein